MRCTEKNFIKRLKQHKEEAMEFVIDEYMPYVKAIIHKILYPTGRTDLVEDCISNVFLAVWQNSHQFSGDPNDFKRWIGTVSKYQAIDQYRRLEKQQAKEQGMPENHEPAAEIELQEQVLKREEKNELLLALSKLGELDRDIFTMKYFLEMPNAEIAQALHLSKAAVDNRLYRGKKSLASLLTIKMRERWI